MMELLMMTMTNCPEGGRGFMNTEPIRRTLLMLLQCNLIPHPLTRDSKLPQLFVLCKRTKNYVTLIRSPIVPLCLCPGSTPLSTTIRISCKKDKVKEVEETWTITAIKLHRKEEEEGDHHEHPPRESSQ